MNKEELKNLIKEQIREVLTESTPQSKLEWYHREIGFEIGKMGKYDEWGDEYKKALKILQKSLKDLNRI
jgi:hypothetical protein